MLSVTDTNISDIKITDFKRCQFLARYKVMVSVANTLEHLESSVSIAE